MLKFASFTLAALVSCVCIPPAVMAISATIKGANVEDLAQSIELGQPVTPAFLNSFQQSHDLYALGKLCSDSVSRATVTVAVEVWKSARNAQDTSLKAASLAQTIQIIDQRLECTATDANAWLLRSMLALDNAEPAAKVVSALHMSYKLGPYESWIVWPRLRFATQFYETGDFELAGEFESELATIVATYKAKEVAKLYAESGGKVHSTLHYLIAGQAENRQLDLVGAINSLGVSLKGLPQVLDGSAKKLY